MLAAQVGIAFLHLHQRRFLICAHLRLQLVESTPLFSGGESGRVGDLADRHRGHAQPVPVPLLMQAQVPLEDEFRLGRMKRDAKHDDHARHDYRQNDPHAERPLQGRLGRRGADGCGDSDKHAGEKKRQHLDRRQNQDSAARKIEIESGRGESDRETGQHAQKKRHGHDEEAAQDLAQDQQQAPNRSASDQPERSGGFLAGDSIVAEHNGHQAVEEDDDGPPVERLRHEQVRPVGNTRFRHVHQVGPDDGRFPPLLPGGRAQKRDTRKRPRDDDPLQVRRPRRRLRQLRPGGAVLPSLAEGGQRRGHDQHRSAHTEHEQPVAAQLTCEFGANQGKEHLPCLLRRSARVKLLEAGQSDAQEGRRAEDKRSRRKTRLT